MTKTTDKPHRTIFPTMVAGTTHFETQWFAALLAMALGALLVVGYALFWDSGREATAKLAPVATSTLVLTTEARRRSAPVSWAEIAAPRISHRPSTAARGRARSGTKRRA